MGTVHQLIEAHGKQTAMVLHLDRAEIEAAAAYLADERIGTGFYIAAGAKRPCPISVWLMMQGGKSPANT